jgi:sec-independent protein translocase protein TatA
MFGSIGTEELILIFIVALLVFGPKRLPEIGRTVGKALREFKRTSEEIKGRIESEIEASELKSTARDLHTGIRDAAKDLFSETKEITETVKKGLDDKDTGDGPKDS